MIPYFKRDIEIYRKRKDKMHANAIVLPLNAIKSLRRLAVEGFSDVDYGETVCAFCCAKAVMGLDGMDMTDHEPDCVVLHIRNMLDHGEFAWVYDQGKIEGIGDEDGK